MDGTNNMQGESGAYIWLRYETQFEKDGRKHTLEMGIPVPLGASADVREQLFREAEEGLQQLTTHVSSSSFQHLSRAQTASGATGRMAPQPAASTKPTPAQQTTNTQRTNTPANRPASLSAPQTSMQPVGSEHSAPAPERARAGGMMLPASEPGNNMPLPQFIQYIKDNLGLTPKQAMEILNVRSLTTGINLRDALDQLRAQIAQSGSSPSGAQPTRQNSGPLDALEHISEEHAHHLPSGPLPQLPHNEPRATNARMEMQEGSPAAGFDEELDLEDLDDPGNIGTNLDNLEEFSDSGDEFSPAELEQALERIGSLRSIQGATTVSASRLQVLNNVVSSQINEEQLQALILGIWEISALKKLKVDQVEELISWAKREDNFIEQVEAIFKVLEEEHYARGNR